jgi:hypothetical protein
VQRGAGGICEPQQPPVGEFGEAAGHLGLHAERAGLLPGVDDVRRDVALLRAVLRDEREVLGSYRLGEGARFLDVASVRGGGRISRCPPGARTGRP